MLQTHTQSSPRFLTSCRMNTLLQVMRRQPSSPHLSPARTVGHTQRGHESRWSALAGWLGTLPSSSSSSGAETKQNKQPNKPHAGAPSLTASASNHSKHGSPAAASRAEADSSAAAMT